jgi:hypothetical protein
MPEVTKRKVTMRTANVIGYDEDSKPIVTVSGAEDYVRPDFLDEYVADARTRWQDVTVSEEPDAGPGGYEGATYIPETLNHPEAGKYFPAEGEAIEGEVVEDDKPRKRGGGKVSAFLPGNGVLGNAAFFLGLQASLAVAVATLAAAIQTTTQKNTVATAYGTAATYAALYTTVPGGSAGTEVSGGSPAYARKALTWGAASNGVITVTVTFDVPASTTVVGAGVHTAVTAGTYLDGASVTSQNFASQGTYQVTLTYTQT